MSTRFATSIGGDLVAIYCAPTLAVRAEGLLAHLAKLHARGRGLADGDTISCGGSLLALRRQRGELVVHEPAFDGDPLSETRPDVTTTLRTLDSQIELLARCSAPAQPTMFWETVTVPRGTLDVRRVYLHRHRKLSMRDSGWSLAPLDGEAEGLGTLFVHEILAKRPALVPALAFPEGWLVVFDGNRVQSVLDPSERQVWPAPRRASRERYAIS